MFYLVITEALGNTTALNRYTDTVQYLFIKYLFRSNATEKGEQEEQWFLTTVS